MTLAKVSKHNGRLHGDRNPPLVPLCIDRTHGGQVFGDMVDTFKHKRLVPGGQSGKAY